MAQQILVALKSQDRLSHMIPYIAKIAQPGMKVVFLIRSGPQGSTHESLDSNRHEEARFVGYLDEARNGEQPLRDRRFIDEQRLMAEHKVFLAEEALLKRGIEVAVDVYTGCLRKVVKSYLRTGNVNMIIKRAGGLSRVLQLLSRTVPNSASFMQSGFPPVHLLWTDHAA